MAFEAMHELAVASTYSGSSNKISSDCVSIPFSQQTLQSSSSFSNAYNNFFTPPAISYSTPTPSIIDNFPACIENLPSNFSEQTPSTNTSTFSAVLPSSSY